MFSALRQGAPLYILEKGDSPNVKIGVIESVTLPRPKYTTFNPSVSFTANMETIVDIIANIDNEKKEIIGVPSNASVHEYGNIVVSESRDAMISEVSGMLQASQRVLDSEEYHRNVIKACEGMLKDLNPDYAKQQERDDAIDSLKDEVGSLKQDMSKILALLTKAEVN